MIEDKKGILLLLFFQNVSPL